MRHITKTSVQAKLEKKMNTNKDNTCPECDFPNLGVREYESRFFKHRKRNVYKCFRCGCQWHTDWEKI